MRRHYREHSALDWKLKPTKHMDAVSTLRKSKAGWKASAILKDSSAKFKLQMHVRFTQPNSHARAALFYYLCSRSLCPLAAAAPPSLDGLIFNFTFFWVCNQLCVHARRHILMWRARYSLISIRTHAGAPHGANASPARTHEGKEKEIETFEINQTLARLFLSHSLAPPQIIKTLNASSVPFARTHQPEDFRSKINI
jgi:hypothetical protein